MMVLYYCGSKTMKMIHVLTLFLAVIGGLHFTLMGFGTDLIGTIFGNGEHITMIHIAIGLSTLWHVTPMLKTHLAAM